MKTSLVIGIVVVIIGVGVVYSISQKEPALAPATTETSPNSNGNMPTAEDHGMTPEEHARMMQAGETSPNANDVILPPKDATTEDHSMMNMDGMDHSTMNMQKDPTSKIFTVSGKNFMFDVTEIRVNEGDTVTINFTSADGFHDLVIDAFSARTEKMKTGGTSSVTFVADKKGTFEYYCSVGQHRANGMIGKLVVE